MLAAFQGEGSELPGWKYLLWASTEIAGEQAPDSSQQHWEQAPFSWSGIPLYRLQGKGGNQ